MGKRMPDDFVFPACAECQTASRQAEGALSLLLIPRRASEEDRAALRERAAYYRRRDPRLIEGLFLTRRQKRQVLKELGLEKPPRLFLDDLPLVKLNVERWKPHLDIIASKLILALHYKYVGRPLPPEGRMYPVFFFNAHLADGDLLRQFEEAAQNLENPRHGNEDLAEQIQVRWGVDVEHGAGVFLIHLHDMLFVFGVTAEHPEWRTALEEDGDEDVRGPLD